MTKRWLIPVVLVCSLAMVTPGCKKWFGGKNKGLSDNPNGGSDLPVGGTDTPGNNTVNRPTGFENPNVVVGQFDTVLFAFDSAQVEDAQRAKVETVANYLKSNSSAVLILEGHCDERGSTEYNMSLGERRALAVRQYLMTMGIDNARMQTKSLGKEKPKDPGHSESAWTVNRRVEFVLLKN